MVSQGQRRYLLSGLNEYLVEKREAVRAQKKRTQEAGYPPNRYQAQVSSDDRTGVRKIQIRDFKLASDSGAAGGGFDLGPTPVELLFASLGSCIVSTFLNQAATRGVPLDSVEIAVSGQTDPRANLPNYSDVPNFPHAVSYVLRVVSSAPADTITELFEAAERLCPISVLFAKSQEVHGQLIHETLPVAVNSIAS
jgi:uncharacterized OsmC-like protein